MYHRQIRVEWLYLSLLKELNRLPQMCSPHVDLISTSKISPKITSHWCPIGGIGGAEKLSPCPFAQWEKKLGSRSWGIHVPFLESIHRRRTVGYFGEKRSAPAQPSCRRKHHSFLTCSEGAHPHTVCEWWAERCTCSAGAQRPSQVPVPVFSFQWRVNISRTQ